MSFPHFSLTLPLTYFQFPSTLFQSMACSLMRGCTDNATAYSKFRSAHSAGRPQVAHGWDRTVAAHHLLFAASGLLRLFDQYPGANTPGIDFAGFRELDDLQDDPISLRIVRTTCKV